jgi:hypothetical protein
MYRRRAAVAIAAEAVEDLVDTQILGRGRDTRGGGEARPPSVERRCADAGLHRVAHDIPESPEELPLCRLQHSAEAVSRENMRRPPPASIETAGHTDG